MIKNYVTADIEPNFLQIPIRYAQVFDHVFNPNDVSPVAAVKARFENDIRKGGYTEQDQKIAEFLLTNTFATQKQLISYFNIPAEYIENFSKRLKYLVKDRFINSFTLHLNPASVSKFDDELIIYCLDFGGKYVLENFGDNYVGDWYSTKNMQSSKLVAKTLMTTQFYIDLQNTIHHNMSDEKASVFLDRYMSTRDLVLHNDLFTSNAQIDLKFSNINEKSLLLDVVYNGEEGADFRTRIKNISELLHTAKYQQYFDLNNKPPMVILLTANLKEQLPRIMRTISHATKFTTNEFLLLDSSNLGKGFLDDKNKFMSVSWTLDDETNEPKCIINQVTFNAFGKTR